MLWKAAGAKRARRAVLASQYQDLTPRLPSLPARRYLENKSIALISTNQDEYDIMPSGRHVPDAGVIVRAVEVASNRKALNCGKPSDNL
jgi:ribonucleotide monophosphatase NagD (HAD superfamily)